MKRVIQAEVYSFINDFTGEHFDHNIVPVTLIMEFGYGSKRDGHRIELHFGDEHAQEFLDLIQKHRKLCKIVE